MEQTKLRSGELDDQTVFYQYFSEHIQITAIAYLDLNVFLEIHGVYTPR
jgi:hypothetical protein